MPSERPAAGTCGAPSKKNDTGTCKICEICCKPAGADAVGALLVFLHLLKGQAERVSELLLAHAQHHPAHAHPAADMLVDRIGGFLCYHIINSYYPYLPNAHTDQIGQWNRYQCVNESGEQSLLDIRSFRIADNS